MLTIVKLVFYFFTQDTASSSKMPQFYLIQFTSSKPIHLKAMNLLSLNNYQPISESSYLESYVVNVNTK